MGNTHPNVKAILGICVVCSLLCGAGATEARADVRSEQGPLDGSQEKREHKPVDFKLRFQHPFSSLYLTDRDSVLFGMSLGLDVKQLYAFEFGGDTSFQYTIDHNGTDYRLFFRVGLMPTLIDNRRSNNKGSTLQFGGLLGYSYSYLSYYDAREKQIKIQHFVTLSGALDYTYWVAKYFGFCFRLLLDLNIPFKQQQRGYFDTNMRNDLFFNIAISLGIAF
jgi:hypothetical protein